VHVEGVSGERNRQLLYYRREFLPKELVLMISNLAAEVTNFATEMIGAYL
jgi:hypothetical protein